MTTGRAALVELMRRYMQGLLDPAISLLEVHKLMYFMQEAGEPLRLKYVQGPYGPYAGNLRHAWNTPKQQFTKRHIGIAVEVLTKQGWISKGQISTAA